MEIEIKKENELKKKKFIASVVKISLLIIIVIGVPLYIYFFRRDWLLGFENFDSIVSYLTKHEKESIPIFIGIQILQVVVSFIPGQACQVAAGYIYSFWTALFFSVLGAALGTMISFWMARFLGYDFIHTFFAEEKMSYYIERLNSKRAYTIVFFLYLIPGLPKDIVSYAAGASDMNFKPFILLSVIGRLPGMIGSILIGSMWEQKDYTAVIIIAIIAVLAFIMCVIFRKKINTYLDKFYKKIRK